MKKKFTGNTRLFLCISGAIIVVALIMQIAGVGLNLGLRLLLRPLPCRRNLPPRRIRPSRKWPPQLRRTPRLPRQSMRQSMRQSKRLRLRRLSKRLRSRCWAC